MNEYIIWSPGVTLDHIEEQVIRKAYSHFRNNKTATANALGIAIRTLDNKLALYAEQEKKRDEERDNERRKREEFIQRSRFGSANQHSMESVSTVYASTTGHAMESSSLTPEIPTLPLHEPKTPHTVLPVEVTSSRGRKHR